MSGTIFLDGATQKTFALTGAECIVCHDGNAPTGEPYLTQSGNVHLRYTPQYEPDGTMKNEHHIYPVVINHRSCNSCHSSTWFPDPVSVNDGKKFGVCINCHYTGTPIFRSLDINQAHGLKHDKTDVPQAMCLDCHVGNVFDEHSGRTLFVDAEGDLNCALCHSSTDQNVLVQIALGSGLAGQIIYCDDCHSNMAGGSTHTAQHDNVTPDSADCTSCHAANVVDEHLNRGWTCSTCHAGETLSLDSATVLSVIEQGSSSYLPAPIAQNCSSCHGIVNHEAAHDHALLPTDGPQDCTFCHADNVVTEHVTNRNFVCATCHESVRTDVLTTIDTGRAPSNQDVFCSGCHAASGQGDGHTPVSVEPWNECLKCHSFTSLLQINRTTGAVELNPTPIIHDTHTLEAETAGFTCSICHAPVPNCTQCHDNNTGFPWLNIVGPGELAHDFHTDTQGFNCDQCHVSGVPGGTPIPAPYDTCKSCHNATDTRTKDIAYGTPVHDGHMAAASNNCAICHTDTPDCASCHTSGHPALPAPFNACDDCHSTLQPDAVTHEAHRAAATDSATGKINCAQCHTAQPDCSTCHVAGHPAVPAPYDTCDQCHETLQPGGVTHDTHKVQATHPTTNRIECDICHTQTPNCSVCHVSEHPSVQPPNDTCDTCHTNTLQPGETTHEIHKTKATDQATGYINCAVCHTTQPVDCTVCHTFKHEPVPAGFEACDQCHTNLQPGATTHDAHKTAVTDQATGAVDCAACHVSTATCADCHTPGHPDIPAPFNTCDSCHADMLAGQPIHDSHRVAASQDCAVCHTSAPDCGQCHTGTLHEAIPAPYNSCDDCHTAIQPTSVTHEAHKTQTNNNCAVCHTAQPDCAACHNAQPHGPITAPYDTCSSCHDGTNNTVNIAYNQQGHNAHITASGNDCATCHTATPDCSACHTAGHDPVPAQFQTCDSCHSTLQPGQATHDAHKTAANNNCASCHTASATCADCHSPGHPAITTFDECTTCHTAIQPGTTVHTNHRAATGQDCTACHNAAPNCTECHTAGHEPVPVQFQACDSCHSTLQPGQATHDAHKTAAGNNCATCHTASATCTSCHTAGDHKAEHNNLGATETCQICHTDKINGTNFQYIVTYHPPLAVYGGSEQERCATCHTSTRTDVVNTIANGRGATGVAVGCVDCHTATHLAIEPSKLHNNVWINTGSTCSNCHIADNETHTDMMTSGQCSGCHVSSTQTEINTLHKEDCMLCHLSSRPEVLATITEGIAGTQVDCNSCHTGHEPVPATFQTCDQCHTNLQPGQTTHNAHITAANNNCASCHAATATCADCHSPSHPAIPAPYNACDDCHTTLQPTQVTHEAHKTAASNNCAVCHNSSPAPNCGQCHTGTADHNAAHDMASVPSAGCTNCHDANVVVEHVDNRGWTCNTCHNSTNQTVVDAIAAGKAGTQVDCYDCHGTNNHHATVEAQNGNCAHCHADPRPLSNDPQQLACRECHIDNNGYVQTTLQTSPSHSFNTNGSIQDFGACFACHAPVPYHAKPTTAPDCWDLDNNPAAAPGKGTFNLFRSDFQRSEKSYKGTSRESSGKNACKDNRNRWTTSQGINYNMYSIVYQGQSMSVPVLDSGQAFPNPTHNMITAVSNCADCHDTSNVVTATHIGNCIGCHLSADQTVQNSINQGIAGSPVDCADCHGSQGHAAQHNMTAVPDASCSECHVDNVVTEHIDNNIHTCTTCHSSTDLNVINAISSGIGGQTVTCMDCHLSADHLTLHAATSLDQQTCADCHTANVVSEHLNRGRDCNTCHTSTVPAVIDTIAGVNGTVTCTDCHGANAGDHQAAHDSAGPAAGSNCVDCHATNIVDEHLVNQPLSCTNCHDNPTYASQITAGMAGTYVSCEDCHGASAGDHQLAHDMAGVPSSTCTTCHDANVVTEHVYNRGFTCDTCHSSTVSNIVNTISTGQAGNPVDCYDCHGTNSHHTALQAQAGNCTYCHADPRLDIDPSAPTGQLACRECHTDNSGMVTAVRADHRFNTQGDIQDFGACFACHTPTPYHAKPASRPQDCNSTTPGKGTFNFFSNEFGGGSKSNKRNDRCDGQQSNYNNPTISFSMVNITSQLSDNRQYSVPYFGTGGGSNNDIIAISVADFDSTAGTLTVYADNALGTGASLTAVYNGNNYPMSWNSSNNTWEVVINTTTCISTVQVVSSAGGSASNPVNGCSTGGGGGTEPPPTGGGSGDVDPNGTIIEAEEYDVFGNNWDLRYDMSSASGGYLYATTNSTSNTSGSPVEFTLNFVETGTYFIDFLMHDNGSSGDNSLWYGVDGSMVGNVTSPGSNTYWNWANTPHNTGPDPAQITINSIGTHTILIWAREDGLSLDQFRLTRDGGSSGGGGGDNDSITITRARYDDVDERLEFRAENSLEDNATLYVQYNGDSYEMNWDSGDDRWELKIETSSCQDSTIEIVSSAGGSETSSVDNCSSSDSWRR